MGMIVMTDDDIALQVKSLDLDAMTEDDARLAAIPLLEAYVEKHRFEAHGSLIFDFLLIAIGVLLFGDAATDADMTYESYRLAKKALKKFRSDTYGKSYIAFLKDWQERILRSEENAEKRQKNSNRKKKE